MIIGARRAEEAKALSSYEGYHRLADGSTVEIFWHEPHVNQGDEPPMDRPGWFWWSCHPGCLPDGEPSGPFGSSSLAHSDAEESCDDYQ